MPTDAPKRGAGNRSFLFGLILIGTLMVWSTAQTFSGPQGFNFFGKAPAYLGIVTWVVYIGLGVAFRKIAIDCLLSVPSLIISALIIVISLYSNIFYIRHGFRIGGVMFQATTMGMYGALAAVIAGHSFVHSRSKRVAGFGIVTLVVSLMVILLSQSRIGLFSAAIVITCYSVVSFQSQRAKSLFMAALLAMVVLLPRLQSTYFSRFQTQSINRGTSYRLDLYRTSGQDLLRHNLLLGNGPDTLPTAINNPNQVPEEIAATLKEGMAFNSTHDLYFDIAYFFGVVCALVLAGLTMWALKKAFQYGLSTSLLLIVLVVNALFNVPSLELSSLFFVVLSGVLLTNNQPTKEFASYAKSTN